MLGFMDTVVYNIDIDTVYILYNIDNMFLCPQKLTA